MTLKVESRSEEETLAFARKLAAQFKAGDVLLMEGDLGAGKTCVSRGVAQGLGCQSPATSPTFTLVQEYTGGRLPVYHIDLYRLESLRDMESLGLDEYFDGDGVSLVEWAGRLKEAGYPVPAQSWRLRIRRLGEQGRLLELDRP